MTVTVTGLQESLDALDVFKRSRIPGATAWALDQLGYALRKNEQAVIERTFDSAVAFTRNAPLFTKASKQNLSITFFLRDNAPGGQSPDRYLYPQVEGGEVYVTRFSRALRRAGLIQENDYVLHWGNPKYKPTAGRITSILAALRRNVGPLRGGGQYTRSLREINNYLILGRDQPKRDPEKIRRGRRSRTDGYDGPGIYTRKANGKLELVYRILANVPRVPKKYDWSERRIGAFAQEKLPGLLLGKLKEL